MIQAGKPLLIEALVAQLDVEAFVVDVLDGLSGTDEAKAVTFTIVSLVQYTSCKLTAVVYSDRDRRAAPGDSLIHFARNAPR